MIRERIYKYLKESGAGKTSDQILSTVLKIRSPNSASADSVLQSIIGNDPRFRFAGGFWIARETATDAGRQQDLAGVALFILKPALAAHPLSMRVGLHLREAQESQEFDLTGPLARLDVDSLQRWRMRAETSGLLLWSSDTLRSWNRLLQSCRFERHEGNALFLKTLAARALPLGSGRINPEALASHLAIPFPETERPAEMAQLLSACFDSVIEMVPMQHRLSSASLARWIDERRPAVDFSRMSFGRDHLRKLPEGPGVYVMRNRAADIIYVGKAGNLKRRVSSYFTSRALKDSKGSRLLEQIYSLETITTASELDALLLETRLIRDFRPSVNLQVEVHEQPARYGKGGNLVILAPQSDGEKVHVYFLREGVFVDQQEAQAGRSAAASLRTRLKAVYFPAMQRAGKCRESWEMEIVSRWLSRNRNRINYIDMDDVADIANAIRLLNSYLHDPDRLSKKVLYR